MTCRSSEIGDPTQVRWATGVMVVSAAMRSVTRTVRCRSEPPAPYVTETKVGASPSSSRKVCHSARSPSSVLGGKNSNE